MTTSSCTLFIYNRYRQLGTNVIWLVCRYVGRIRDGQVSIVLRVEFRTAMDADHTEHLAISGPRRTGETRTGLKRTRLELTRYRG